MRSESLALISLSMLRLLFLASLPVAPFQTKAEEAKNKTVYIDLSLVNPKNPSIKFQDGSIVELAPIGDGIYQSTIELPLPFSTFCIEDEGRDSPWIQEPSLYDKDLYNYICLGVDDSISYGFFGLKFKNPGATYATQRVWLMGDLSDCLDPWGQKGTNAIGYYKDGQYQITAMESVVSAGTTYYFADIPANNTSFVFLSLSSQSNHDYVYLRTEEVKGVAYGCCYEAVESEALKTVYVHGADVKFLAEVVSSYLTYGKDPSNGCTVSTIQSLYHTFFANKSATDLDLRNTKILDYTGYEANNKSYEGLIKTASFSVNEKWNTMCAQAGIDPKTGQIKEYGFSPFSSASGKALIIFIGIATAIGIAFGAIPFIKLHKRKQGL